MANPITNKVKTGGIPVIKKDLDSGVIAEANNDGTIYLDKKVKNDSPLAKEAIAHEMVHMDQMARGDLDYNDDKVFWKGKAYTRDDMNEGAKNLPWEKEAYNKTKNMKKSPAKLSLSQGALDTNEGVILTDLHNKAGKRGAMVGAVDNVLSAVEGMDAFKPKNNNPNDQDDEEEKSPATMKATPITKKSQYGGSSSPLHIEDTDAVKEFKGNNQETDEFGTFKVETKPGEKSQGGYQKVYDNLPEKDGKKYNPRTGTVYNQVSDFENEAKKKPAAKGSTNINFEADKDKNQDPAVPGSTERNMGYYESMDSKYGASVRGRGAKKEIKQSSKAASKYDRLKERNKIPFGPDGKEMTKQEYVSKIGGAYKGKYNIPVGKSRITAGKEAGPITETNTASKKGEATYKKIDGKLVKVDEKGNPIVMNKNSKNKSAFKMKGWQAK